MSKLHEYVPNVHRLPNRNAIINGGMDVWQRGTATLTNPGSGTYFPDRFKFQGVLSGDGTINLLQSVETPTVGFPFNYSLQVDCTHIETVVAADEFAWLWYNVEGYDFKRFEGETATLSFWVKAVKTGIYCVAFANNAADKSYIAEYTINSASTWEKKTITLTFNSGGTFLYTTGIGLRISWAIMNGSNLQTTANAWQAGQYYATSNQVNGLDSTDNNFWLTGVQLELGSVATPFEQRPFAQELALCQRYCKTILGTTSAAVLAVKYATKYIDAELAYTPMRASPTLVTDITTWKNSATPAVGEAAAFNAVTGQYVQITGALTVSMSNSNPERSLLRLTAGTSFDGTDGDTVFMMFNASTSYLNAEL